MRIVTFDEAIYEIRELIAWVDKAGQDALVIQDGRVIVEVWPASDYWQGLTLQPDSATGRRDSLGPTVGFANDEQDG